MTQELTLETFKELVFDYEQSKEWSYKGDIPCIIDFWAPWCGPCRAIAPVIDELYTELSEKAVIGKVNVDENSDVPMNYGVRNIPTLLVFKNGEIVDKVVGNQPKSKLLEILTAHM